MKILILSLLLLLSGLYSKAQLNYHQSQEELHEYAKKLLQRHAKVKKVQFNDNYEEIEEFAIKLNLIMGQMGIIGQHLAFEQKEVTLRKKLIEETAIEYGEKLSIELVNDAYAAKKYTKNNPTYVSKT
ncbi:MAG: hypothetical protein MK212_17275, partial [Saprospiraceae bacterium]|nr:hypothetical protein [Saprospiraceae bacterium]